MKLQAIYAVAGVLAVMILAGCVSTTTAAISRIDEEDVSVQVSSTDWAVIGSTGAEQYEKLTAAALPEAVSGCGRYGRSPEYLSHRRVSVGNTFTGSVYEVLYACNP